MRGNSASLFPIGGKKYSALSSNNQSENYEKLSNMISLVTDISEISQGSNSKQEEKNIHTHRLGFLSKKISTSTFEENGHDNTSLSIEKQNIVVQISNLGTTKDKQID
jgi:hypothetical protein